MTTKSNTTSLAVVATAPIALAAAIAGCGGGSGDGGSASMAERGGRGAGRCTSSKPTGAPSARATAPARPCGRRSRPGARRLRRGVVRAVRGRRQAGVATDVSGSRVVSRPFCSSSSGYVRARRPLRRAGSHAQRRRPSPRGRRDADRTRADVCHQCAADAAEVQHIGERIHARSRCPNPAIASGA